MCLIVFAWRVIPGVPVIACANRDEFYDRPATPAGPWPENPDIIAGRDLQGGGSWMGVTRHGAKFAALTNIRAPASAATTRRRAAPWSPISSRASSTRRPTSTASPRRRRVQRLQPDPGRPRRPVLVLEPRRRDPRNGKALEPGIYGVSNGLLDAPWPKVLRTKATFASLLLQGAPEEAYFEMLADTTRAPDLRLPDTGVPIEVERQLSAVCIEIPGYGTRTSTVVKLYSAPGRASPWCSPC
jgi:uncharacterized protein with NRDE domain